MNELEKQKKNKWLFIALFLILVITAICFYLFLFPKFNSKKDNNQESNLYTDYVYYDSDFSMSGNKTEKKILIAFKNNTKVLEYVNSQLIIDINGTGYYFDTMPITVTPKDEYYYNHSHRYKENNIEKVNGNYYLLKNLDDSYSIFYKIEEGVDTQSTKRFVLLFGTIIGKYTNNGFVNHMTREEALNIIETIKKECLILSYTDDIKEAKDEKDTTYDFTKATKVEDYLREAIEKDYNISTDHIEKIDYYEIKENNNYKSKAYFSINDHNRELRYELTEAKKEMEGEVKSTFTINDVEVSIIMDEAYYFTYKYNDKIIIVEDVNGFNEQSSKENFKKYFTK